MTHTGPSLPLDESEKQAMFLVLNNRMDFVICRRAYLASIERLIQRMERSRANDDPKLLKARRLRRVIRAIDLQLEDAPTEREIEEAE